MEEIANELDSLYDQTKELHRLVLQEESRTEAGTGRERRLQEIDADLTMAVGIIARASLRAEKMLG